MEKVGDSDSYKKQPQMTSTEDEIEALERELARLKSDIHEQEQSIAKIDEIKRKAAEASPAVDNE